MTKDLTYIPSDTLAAMAVADALDTCDLTHWLATIFDADDVAAAAERYFIGQHQGAAVFWQVDAAFNIRAGKVMRYDADGHRIKAADGKAAINWVHTLLPDAMPQGYKMTRCFFGEHLLTEYPDDAVHIVESEKTAVICSIIDPSKVWLATAGKGNLASLNLDALKGRDVVLIPDADGVAEWSKTLPRFDKCRSIALDDQCRQMMLGEETRAHYDLADYILDAINGLDIDAEKEQKRIAALASLPRNSREFEEWFQRFERLAAMKHPLQFSQFLDLCKRHDPLKVAEEIRMAERCFVWPRWGGRETMAATIETYLEGLEWQESIAPNRALLQTHRPQKVGECTTETLEAVKTH